MKIKKETINQAFFITVSMLLSFIVASLIMMAVGYDPLKAYTALYTGSFGSTNAIATTLSKSIPLIFTGLAFSFALKGGTFNIGAEGQLYAGAMLGTIIIFAFDGMPRYVVIIMGIIGGIIGGAIIGGITGFIKTHFKVSEVITSIMINYIVQYSTSYLVSYPYKEEGAMTAQTVLINSNYMLSNLIEKTQLTTAFIIAIICAVIMMIFFKKTKLGFNIRAVGENKTAALAGGIPMMSTAIVTMAISGGLAGLAGVTEVMGKTGRFIDGFSPGFGFTGIAVAVLGNNNPIGIIFSAILFGALDAGAVQMSIKAGVSSSMTNVIQGIVILFVASPNIIRMIKLHKKGEK